MTKVTSDEFFAKAFKNSILHEAVKADPDDFEDPYLGFLVGKLRMAWDAHILPPLHELGKEYEKWVNNV